MFQTAGDIRAAGPVARKAALQNKKSLHLAIEIEDFIVTFPARRCTRNTHLYRKSGVFVHWEYTPLPPGNSYTWLIFLFSNRDQRRLHESTLQVGNCKFQDFHLGKTSGHARSPHENLGICNFLPAMWIRAISVDRDLKIER